MRRVGNLYSRIADPDNLRLAFVKARKGKRHRPDAIAYQRTLDANLAQLREQLLSEDVPVGDYHYFTVFDPKERRICAGEWTDVLYRTGPHPDPGLPVRAKRPVQSRLPLRGW